MLIVETNREVVGSWKKIKNEISQASDEILDIRILVPSKPWVNNF